MIARSVFITGCNRGIGLELVRQFVKLDNRPEHIIASCRDPDGAKDLQEIAQKNSNVHIIKLDVKNFDQFDTIAEQVGDIVGKENGLNLLINNAGILPKEVPLSQVTAESMLDGFQVNCLAPLFLTRAILPLLQTAAKVNLSGKEGRHIGRAAVVQMSTAMASLDDNTGGSYYAYRCSKVALNMAMRSLSVDLKNSGILVMAMHPGWVRTDMGGPNGLIEAEECSTTMIKTLASLDDSAHGFFLRYNNTKIQW